MHRLVEPLGAVADGGEDVVLVRRHRGRAVDAPEADPLVEHLQRERRLVLDLVHRTGPSALLRRQAVGDDHRLLKATRTELTDLTVVLALPPGGGGHVVRVDLVRGLLRPRALAAERPRVLAC